MKVLIERTMDEQGHPTFQVCRVDDQKNGRILGVLKLDWAIKPDEMDALFADIKAGNVDIER